MYDDDEGDERLRKRRMMMILVQMKNLIYGLPRWVRRTCETATCPRQPQCTNPSAQCTLHFELYTSHSAQRTEQGQIQITLHVHHARIHFD